MLKWIICGLALLVLLPSVLLPGLTAVSSVNSRLSKSASLEQSLLLLGAGARWAAVNGTEALYIDWYDNLISHPVGMEDPDVFFPRRALVSYALEQYGLNVTFAGDVPSDLSGYDVVVIESYWACEPGDEPIIRNYISSGGGVVIIAGVPGYLVTYSKNWYIGMDLSSIQEWFGASLYENTGGYARIVVDHPFGTYLLEGDTVFTGLTQSHAAAASLDEDARVVARWSAGVCFAFTHTFGQGRVYYQADYRTPDALTANFNWTPYVIEAGETATFDASSSQPAWNGTYSAPIVEYLWDFGDGNVTSSAEPVAIHTFLSSGLFIVTLTVLDSEGLNASCSQTIVVEASSILSISTSTPSTFVGFTVGINGTLSDLFGNGLEDETVVLYYTFQGARSWFPISSAVTDNLGHYYVQWIPTATGTFTIRAEWYGNETLLGSASTVTLSTMPYLNQYVFSVESNSTISALAFNTTNSELTFTAGGPSGTKGYVKVTLAKNLVENITDIKVYLDGNEIQYSSTSIGDSWFLICDYVHSTHNVAIELNSSAVPEFPSAMILLLFGITTVLVAVFMKSKNRKTRSVLNSPCL